MELNTVRDRKSARASGKRLGKGQGSGTGKTAGRGMKGQKSRSGVAIKGFEGGQMPLYRRVPKRGFVNIFTERQQEVNLGRIEKWVELGKLNADAEIDPVALEKAGLIRNAMSPVKLLAKGDFKLAKLKVVVDGFSASAKSKVEALGGVVMLREVRMDVGDEGKASLGKAEKPATKGQKAKSLKEEKPSGTMGAKVSSPKKASLEGKSPKKKPSTAKSGAKKGTAKETKVKKPLKSGAKKTKTEDTQG